MDEGDAGGVGGVAEVVVEAVAAEEAPLPSFTALRYLREEKNVRILFMYFLINPPPSPKKYYPP